MPDPCTPAHLLATLPCAVCDLGCSSPTLLQEAYGLISPIPDHDGTECLKWDPSLWSHADHFKVRSRSGGRTGGAEGGAMEGWRAWGRGPHGEWARGRRELGRGRGGHRRGQQGSEGCGQAEKHVILSTQTGSCGRRVTWVGIGPGGGEQLFYFHVRVSGCVYCWVPAHVLLGVAMCPRQQRFPCHAAAVLIRACVYCVQYRWNVFKGIRHAIDVNEGGLEKFTQGEGESGPGLVCCGRRTQSCWPGVPSSRRFQPSVSGMAA